jgi:DHA1 family tetracycline resistance protein-like MFS transporter
MPSTQLSRQASQASPSGHSARLILFLTVFLDLLGFGIVIPFLPMFASKLGVSAFGIGAIMAIYSAMQFLCAPVLGRLSDRVGRRPIIMLGLLGSSAGYLIYGFADSFAGLFISRLVHGACAATISTAQAYVADTTSEETRARGMGMIGAAFGLGFVLGPALGGLLGHSSLRAPAFFASALSFANFVFAAVRLPESHHPEPGVAMSFSKLAAPLVNLPRQLVGHHLSRLFTIAFLLTFAIAAFETTFPLMVPAVYGYGAFGIGAMLAFAGLMQALAQGYLLGKMVTRMGEVRLLMLGLGAFSVGLAPMAELPSGGFVFLALALLSIGYGFASPAVASIISKRSERHQQGEVLGVNQSALSLARISGPLAGGLVYGILGREAPYAGGAIIALMALMLALGIDRAGV